MPYNFDDDSSDDDYLNEDDRNELEERNKKADNHPLQQHLKELMDTTTILLGSCDADDEFIISQKEIIHHSLLIIGAKLYSALRSDSYLVCMKNAAIIRSHADYLLLSSHTLNSTNLFNEMYVAVFRNEMEEFRELFISWAKQIKEMDKEDFEDEWGFF